jgi:hypothetical protein
LDHREIGSCGLLISACDPSEVLGFVEEALDEVTLFVDVWIMAYAPCAAAAGWDHGLGAGLIYRRAEVIGVIGSVREDMPGRQVGDERMGVGDVAGPGRG